MMAIVGYLVWDRNRLMKELKQTYRMRDRWRLAYTKAKGVLTANNLHVDMSDMGDLMNELNGDGG